MDSNSDGIPETMSIVWNTICIYAPMAKTHSKWVSLKTPIAKTSESDMMKPRLTDATPGLPRVSIGLPVHNGGRYLKETVDSILTQTFEDFELIISDNASTDGTGEILQPYAARDPRVRYFRNETNFGAARNFNRVFELAAGDYFKWTAHDDICAPNFLLRCVEVLDRDPSVTVCYTRQTDIDEQGQIIGRNPYGLNTGLMMPHERFSEVMRFWRGAPAIWGLMRRSILTRTPLIGNYYASDLVLLAELALYGRFFEIPEDLLFHRDHASRSVYVSRPQEMVAWLDPTKLEYIGFPTWRWFVEYLLVVGRVPLDWTEKVRCWLHVMKWLRWRWAYAREDITFFAKQVFKSLFL